jgi:hypothetical protein
MIRSWLLFTMTGYCAALAAMNPKVESQAGLKDAPFMGERCGGYDKPLQGAQGESEARPTPATVGGGEARI